MDATTWARCFTQNGWNLTPVFELGLLIADVPSPRDAEKVADNYIEFLAASAKRLGMRKAVIRHPGLEAGKFAYSIPSRMAIMEEDSLLQGAGTMANDRQLDLLGADYVRILEFLMQQRQEGSIVIITSNTTDICYHTNDLLTPGRAAWTPAQFTGYNYTLSWRRDRSDRSSQPTEQYHRLKELLARDGTAPNYEYELFRTDDARCSYSTSYFLCNDWCGDQVRIGVSRPQDWRLLESATA